MVIKRPLKPLKILSFLRAFRGAFNRHPIPTLHNLGLTHPALRAGPNSNVRNSEKNTTMKIEIGSHEHYALVSPQDFTARMDTHWTKTLGMCSSKVLRQLWGIMATTFSEAIADTANAGDAPWRILQPPNRIWEDRRSVYLRSNASSAKRLFGS